MFIGIDVFKKPKQDKSGKIIKDKYGRTTKEMKICMCSTTD